MNSMQMANWRKEYLVNHVKMTSPCLQGLSPFLLPNSSTTVFYSQTYRGITRRNYHIDTNAQEEEIRYQQTEVFMVVKDVDSVMICGAALAQMPKGEKYFANTAPCNTGFSSQSHCSHFQTTALMRPRRLKQYCLQLVIYIYIYDEAQKAETVLSAVIYIYIYIKIFEKFCLPLQFICNFKY